MQALANSGGGAVDTSIVLTTCSRAELLRQCLASLMQQTWIAEHRVELIVVDDGSTDDTAAVLGEWRGVSPVRLIVLQGESRGVAAARNLGCARAAGRWIASFDDDQIASPTWLAALRALADLGQAACVGGALELLLPEGVAADSLGPRVRGILGEHLSGAVAAAYVAPHHPATNNVLVRRDVYAELGGFDTRFTEGGEDKDFFERAAKAGYALWFQPEAHALHVTPQRRLERSNLRWTAVRVGAADARMLLRGGRKWAAVGAVAKRGLVTLLRDVPQLLWAKVWGDERGEANVLCSVWYTQGLVRALGALAGAHPEGSAFLRSINFRNRNGERPGGV